MKKLALVFTILAVLAVGAVPIIAQPSEGAFALASYFPDDIDAYVGVRTDDQAIADIDGIIGKISRFAADFGAEDISSSLRGVFSRMDGVTPEDIDAILAWAGDGLAFGAVSSPSTPDKVYLALLLDDRAAAEAFITARLTDQFEQAEDLGDFTVYEGDGYLLFSDEVLLGVSEATPDELAALTSGDYPRLSDSDEFTAAVSTLPDENYAIGIYTDEDVAGVGGRGWRDRDALARGRPQRRASDALDAGCGRGCSITYIMVSTGWLKDPRPRERQVWRPAGRGGRGYSGITSPT